MGIMAVTALLTGAIATTVNTVNTIINKKIDKSFTEEVKLMQVKEESYSSKAGASSTGSSSPNSPKLDPSLPKPGDDGPAAFSIEPSADIDTIMALLNANYVVHICIIMFIWSIFILFLSNKVVNTYNS
uniref:Uncharacterized protein n=1 Tax=Epichloe typhina TaxID=5113 RepID=A0A1J0CZY5_EPITY|nr:hypothetical protein [Epichloe typhina]APB96742.1 hypothetical protein [Epichloe typhina]